ncbi:MAG: DOPA 4,5-dioxygenase family protein [Pseudomonadota bacterium]
MPRRPSNDFDRYHAHVYYDAASEAAARALCIGAWQHAQIALGRFHRKPVGPHPEWSCQLSFDADEFDRVVPWLDAHRGDLSLLVHPITGDALAEHSTHASWLGESVPMNLDIFR